MNKNTFKTLVAGLAAGMLSMGAAQAVKINGAITFTGTVELDTTSAGTATQVTAWNGFGGTGDPFVSSVDGDFDTFINPGDTATFAVPWSFNSGAVNNFWSTGGFTFDLTASSIDSQGGGAVDVGGTGWVSGNGFEATFGTWNFTTQDPPTVNGGNPPQFSFSASGQAVPDGGMTVGLLGLAVVGLALLRRRLA